VIRRGKTQAEFWCNACGKQVSMVTVDEAAKLARVRSRTIYAWVENSRLHFIETNDGLLLVCSESILPGLLAGEQSKQ
jgi:excisionase family DNA binding protein